MVYPGGYSRGQHSTKMAMAACFLTLCGLSGLSTTSTAIAQNAAGFVVKTVPEQYNVKNPPETPLLKQLLAAYPNDTQPHMLANISNIEAALEKYGTADPWAGKAFYEIGYSYYNLGELGPALQNFNAAIILPDTGNGLRLAEQQLRMLCFQGLGQTTNAIAAAQDVINTPGPAYLRSLVASRAYIHKAQMLQTVPIAEGGGNMAAARVYEEYVTEADKQAAGSDWSNQEAYVMRGLGAALDNAGSYHQAILRYSEFLRRYPTNYDAALIAMERQSDLDGGLMKVSSKEFEAICSHYPITTGPGQIVEYQLGMAYVEEDNYRDAIPVFLRVYNFVPDRNEFEYSANNAEMAGEAAITCYGIAGDRTSRCNLANDILRRFPNIDDAIEIRAELNQWKRDDQVERTAALERELTRIVPGAIVLILTAGFIWVRRQRQLASRHAN